MAQQYGQTTEAGHETPPPIATPSPQSGPGVQAVEGLLRGGLPEPAKVVAILDAHRGERDAIFALLHQTAGNDYVQQVLAATEKLRASIERKEVVAGDPSDPEGGYFLASAAERGARWRTADGRFTGTAGQDGLDSRYQLDTDDALHARVGKDRTGSLAWERDGKAMGELYGSYKSGSDYEVGARRDWELGSGTLTTGLRHRVAGGSTTDGAYGSYRSTDGRTTADGALGVTDGALAGSASFAHAFNDTDKISAGLTHGAAGTSLTASGTRQLGSGGLLSGTGRLEHTPTGTAGSLTGSYRTADGKTTYDGMLGAKDGGFVGSAGVTHAFNDTDKLRAGLAYDPTGTTLTASGSRQLGGGGLLTGDARLQHAPTGTTGALSGTYKTADGRTTYDGMLGATADGFTGSAGFTHAFNDNDKLAATLAHDASGTALTASGTHQFDGGSLTGSARLHHGPLGTTGSLSGAYQDRTTQLDGSYTRSLESDKFHLGGSHQLSPEMTVAGHLDHERMRGGGDQTTFGLSEKYRSGRMIHGLSLEGGRGERDFLGVTGSMDAQLGSRLYAGAWGGFEVESGKQTTGHLGASLTFTPHEKAALTLAGVLDQDGVLETRLQLDVFKKKISGVGDIADHKKDALVSLFLSYSQQAGRPSMLDSRFGASQYDVGRPAGDGQVMAGIRIKF